jgi:glycerol-3-phosphate dehydrogenase subunit B
VTAEREYDAVVIGAGVSGLAAATRMAEAGARVCVVAKGVGSTHLAPGTVDVLAYAPERVDEPGAALHGFVAAHPDHPYALVGPGAVGPALDWFSERIAAGPHPGYRYTGGLERNLLLPTAVGAARPSALVPEPMAGGGLRDGPPVCVAGARVLRDFHPALCAANLGRGGVEARSISVELDLGRPEANALALARRLDEPGFRAGFAERLAPLLRPGERLGLPAALGWRDPHGAWADLQRRLERPVFEIPTLPPSVPGMRVFEALRAALAAARGRLVLGAEVTGVEREGERVTALRAAASGREVRYGARWVVLATGGFASGGIELGSDWMARETVLGLPLRGAPPPGEPRFSPDYFGEHPLARAGVAVDASLRPEGIANLLVAGAALPGAEPWREGSGEGIALASGLRVAELVLEQEGVRAAA